MRKIIFKNVAFGITLMGFVSVSQAIPVQFADNGHWYDVIDIPNINWTDANTLAQTDVFAGLDGHLATITSEEENDFIFSTFNVADRPLWLGGFQEPGTDEPFADWQWVTGEEWVYSNWASGEPNNLDTGNEDGLAFAWFSADGTWNDAPMGWENYGNGGFVVEYETAPVPEPTSILLFTMGLLGFAGLKRGKGRER